LERPSWSRRFQRKGADCRFGSLRAWNPAPPTAADPGSDRDRCSPPPSCRKESPASDHRLESAASLPVAECRKSQQQTAAPAGPGSAARPPPGGSLGPQTRQVVALEPCVGNILIVIVGVTDRGGEIAVHRIDEDDLRRPHPPELLFVLVVVRDLQQAPAVG